ncbi:MAG: peptidase M16 [Desulfuromonas sp.]|nr:MAG: peptidase M16 [Desulfuromonas sp.]
MQRTKLNIGDTTHGFNVLNVEYLKELNTELIQLTHSATGARWVHLNNEDPNNLFAVGFRTPPADSTGIAHILEHTALCGSRNYPVRDPFFSMLKRSLNTFMNAMTASDWTVYPFSSQNRKDFANLLGIYLDAAFFPLLRENDFLQEGHRLEFSEPGNPDSPLEYKGVVYNEMKGAMASPSSLLYRRLGKALYPTTCYHFNSGGEPSDIPDLTWDDLRNFHARYYHPSNAWFYTYGNIPVEEHLGVTTEKVLCHFSRLDIDSSVPSEQRFAKPFRVAESFPLDPGETATNKSIVQTAWLTCDIEESFSRLSLSLLSMLLLGNPAAPLHKALLDSRLGGNLAPGCGFQDDNRTTFFAAGLQATEPENTDAIEGLILETLGKVAETGFTRERIDAVIHRLEFGQREVSGDRYHYSLGLLMRIMGPWLHADDPVSVLKLEDNLDRLRSEAANSNYFPDLIRQYLLDNQHRVTLTLAPDPEMQNRIDAEVEQKLATISEKLSDGEKEQILLKAAELKESQEQEEDLSCLPTLELSDIPEKEPAVAYSAAAVASIPTTWFPQPTNGILYFNAHLSLDGIEHCDLPYLPIYCSLASQVGAAGKSYVEMAQQVEAHTGGISLSSEILDNPEDSDDFEALVSLRGKALNHKQEPFFRILGEFLIAPDFSDIERVRTVLRQLQTSVENAIPGSGHLYAARAGAARLSASAQQRELWSGISLLHLLRNLNALDDTGLRHETDRFAAIAAKLANRDNISFAVTGEENSFQEVEKHLATFSEQLPSATGDIAVDFTKQLAGSGRIGWSTSVPVSYVTRTFKTVPYRHQDAPALMILAKLLRSGFLHREIRERGGAYGGMASCNNEAGLFTLLSYRDPHLIRTLDVYDQAAQWAAAEDFSDEAIKEAKLSVFSDLDRPLSPGGRGAHEFSNLKQGLTLEMRQQLRQQLLACGRHEISAAATRYLVENRERVDSIISGEEQLARANEKISDNKISINKI